MGAFDDLYPKNQGKTNLFNDLKKGDYTYDLDPATALFGTELSEDYEANSARNNPIVDTIARAAMTQPKRQVSMAQDFNPIAGAEPVDPHLLSGIYKMVGLDSPMDRINAVNPTDDDFLRDKPLDVDLRAKEQIPYAVPEADKLNAFLGRVTGTTAQAGTGLLRAFGEHVFPDGSVNGALQTLENISRDAQKVQGMATGFDTEAGALWGNRLMNAGNSMAQMGIGAATGNPLLAMGLMTGGQAYDEARNNGVSPRQALVDAGIQGSAESWFERMGGTGAFFNRLGRGTLKEMGELGASMALREVPTETATTLAQNISAGLFDPARRGTLGEDLNETFWTTLMQGTMMGVPSVAASVAGQRHQRQVDQQIAQRRALSALDPNNARIAQTEQAPSPENRADNANFIGKVLAELDKIRQQNEQRAQAQARQRPAQSSDLLQGLLKRAQVSEQTDASNIPNTPPVQKQQAQEEKSENVSEASENVSETAESASDNPLDVIIANGGIRREALIKDLGWTDEEIAKLPEGVVSDKGMTLLPTKRALRQAGLDTDVNAILDAASRPEAPEMDFAEAARSQENQSAPVIEPRPKREKPSPLESDMTWEQQRDAEINRAEQTYERLNGLSEKQLRGRLKNIKDGASDAVMAEIGMINEILAQKQSQKKSPPSVPDALDRPSITRESFGLREDKPISVSEPGKVWDSAPDHVLSQIAREAQIHDRFVKVRWDKLPDRVKSRLSDVIGSVPVMYPVAEASKEPIRFSRKAPENDVSKQEIHPVESERKQRAIEQGYLTEGRWNEILANVRGTEATLGGTQEKSGREDPNGRMHDVSSPIGEGIKDTGRIQGTNTGALSGRGTGIDESSRSGIRLRKEGATGESVLETGRGLQTLYHGTRDDIHGFELDHPNRKDHGWLGEGVYLTDSPDLAYDYADIKQGEAGKNILPLNARINNPYFATLEEKERISRNPAAGKAFTQSLKERGYDSVVLDLGEGKHEIVVFDPSRIRSAHAQFDPEKTDSNNLLFSFIGERGASGLDRAQEATIRLDNLSIAREMKTAGKDAKAIKFATGWERGADGKWRYEMDDSISVLKPKLFDGRTFTASLEDVLRHELLFAAYPELRKMKVIASDTLPENTTGAVGYTADGEEVLVIQPVDITSGPKILQDIKNIILHEVQHVIQDREGFATGGRTEEVYSRLKEKLDRGISTLYEYMGEPDYVERQRLALDYLSGKKLSEQEIEKLNELEKSEVVRSVAKEKKNIYETFEKEIGVFPEPVSELVKKIYARDDPLWKEAEDSIRRYAYKFYNRISGEVEARNVEMRRDFTHEERLKILGSQTEDVARKDQIFLYQSLKASNLSNKSQTVNSVQSAIENDPVNNIAYVVRSIEELPGHLKEQVKDSGAENDVEGIFDPQTNKVYLIADNLSSPERAVEVARHEVIGHYGMENMLGKERMSYEVKMVQDAISRNNKAIMELSREVKRRQPELSQSDHAKEIIAMMAERNMQNGLVRRVLNAIRKFMKKIGLIDDATDAEIASMLRDARTYLLERNRKMVGGKAAPAFSLNGTKAATHNTADPSDGNAGAGDSQLNTNEPGKAAARKTFDVPDITLGDVFVRSVQDDNYDLKKVIQAIREQGGIVTDKTDAYMSEEEYLGKTKNRLDRFTEGHALPIIEKIRESGVSLEDASQYILARHVMLDKVNSKLKAENPNRKDNEALSGISNQKAREILGRHAANKALRELGHMMDALGRYTRSVMLNGGLITKETHDHWAETYQHYVPLYRDLDGTRRLSAWERLKEADFKPWNIREAGQGNQEAVRRSRGFEVKGTESQRRMGSNLNVTNVIVNAVAQAEGAIIRSEKAKVALALLDLAKANPNDSFWRVDTPLLKKQINSETGLVECVYRDANLKPADNVLVVKERGRERWIVFNEHNKRAMEIAKKFKNLDAAAMNWAVEGIGDLTRWMAGWLTQKNPIFMFFNFQRDLQHAVFNLSDTPIAGKEGQLLKNVPLAMKGYWEITRSAGKDTVDKTFANYAREFKEAGAETGFIKSFESVNDRITDVEKEIKKMSRGNTDPRTWLAIAGRAVDDYNAIAENGVRLAAYVTARESGMTIPRAASLAKNITVNFNKRGTSGRWLNALYMFANANIQGNARMLQALAKSRRARIYAGFMVGIGFAMDMVCSSILGIDDETGKPIWDEISEFDKERNWIVPVSTKKYIKIPLPQGLHILPNAGRMLSELIRTGNTKNALESASRIVLMTADTLSPLGSSGSWLQTATPSVFRPLVQIKENKSFTGSQLYRGDAPYDGYNEPAYAKAFRGTPKHWVNTSKMLNFATGGDDVTPGVINVPPEALRLAFTSFIAPGVSSQVADRALDALVKAGGGDELKLRDLPVISRVIGEMPDERAQERAFYDRMNDWRQTVHQIDEYEKQGRTAEADKAAKRLGDGDLMPGNKRYDDWNSFDADIRRLNKERRQAEAENDKEWIAEVNDKRKQLFADFGKAL